MNHMLTDLMHRVLDGEAAEHERAELERRLAADAELRDQFESLREVHQALDAVPSVDPPADLVTDVLNQLPPVRQPAPPNASVNSGLFSWLQPRSVARYAVTFSMGVAVMALVYQGAERTGLEVDPAQVIGTLAGPDPQPFEETAPPVVVEFSGVSGSIQAARGRPGPLLIFNLEVENEVTVAIPALERGTLVGLSWPAGNPQGFLMDAGRLEVRQTGSQQWVVFLNDPPASLPIHILADGITVHEVAVQFEDTKK